MKYQAIIAILDGVPDQMGEILGTDVTLPTESVKVTYDFGEKVIGSALITRDGDRIVAELSIDPIIMGPQLVQTLCGVIGGRIYDRDNKTITKWTLTDVGLTPIPCDKRLPKIQYLRD